MEQFLQASRRPFATGSCDGAFTTRFAGKREQLRGASTSPSRRGMRSGGTVTCLAENIAIDLVVDRAVDFIRISGDVTRQVLEVVQRGQQIIDRVAPVVVEAAKLVQPVAQQVTKSAVDVSSTAATAAAPAVQGALQTASDVLTAGGVDVGEVQSKTGAVVKTASDVAAPAVKTSFEFLTTSNPVVLGYCAVAAASVYLLGPMVTSFIASASRGYAGDMTAAGALDVILNNGNAFLIDIRSRPEKERNGLLDVPASVAGCVIEVEFAVTESRRLRGQIINPTDVESRVTALQISALRRLSRSSDVFLMDANGSTSRNVARKLQELGFKRCFVMANGFAGWMRSNLQTKPSPMIYGPEVNSPLAGTVFGRRTVNKERRLEAEDNFLLGN